MNISLPFAASAAFLSSMPAILRITMFFCSLGCTLVIYGILFLIVAGPKFYSYRMADFCLMDNPRAGALMAIRRSSVMLHKKRLGLLKLDLRFWWFYLLELAVACLYYGDWILTLAGVDLGLSPELLLFAACVVGLACQLALYIWRKNQVVTAYAMVYQKLKPPTQENQTND